MLVLKGILGGSLKITSENKNNFRGKKQPQNILREGPISSLRRTQSGLAKGNFVVKKRQTGPVVKQPGVLRKEEIGP